MRFVDEVTVQVIAGDGGSGLVSWRREKFVPQGGPDGGDGGNGGAVIFVADPGESTLLDISFSPILRAAHGVAGGANQRSGANGEDLIRKVPLGCQVYWGEDANRRLVADLAAPGARWVAARGGHGGKGNAFFKSSTNRAPDYAQAGQTGETFSFQLVLKSVADVGLIGVPNVGKSTLISAISSARPKVADYPFTTLEPALGVVALNAQSRYVVADIPGLIPGAHAGRGLGLEFLKHIERTAVLAQLIDVTTALDGSADPEPPDPKSSALAQFEAIEQELALYDKTLVKHPRIVLFTKADLPIQRRAFEEAHPILEARGFSCLLISSVARTGLEGLKKSLLELVLAKRKLIVGQGNS